MRFDQPSPSTLDSGSTLVRQKMKQQTTTQPHVAMLVFNDCRNDARVLREADTLSNLGYHVRIFALANSKYPAGVTTLSTGVEIDRLPVRSLYHLAFAGLSSVYHFARRTRRLRERAQRRAQPQGRFRSRREKRAAVARMPKGRRVRRAARQAVAEAGVIYRMRLRILYLATHRRLRRVLLGIHRPTMIAAYWRASARAVAAWNPNVVHAHDANTLPGAARAARRSGARLVYDSHELWRHRNRHGEWRPLGRVVDAFMESRYVRRCDAVISVSPGLVAWLANKYGLHGRYRKRGRTYLLRNTPSRVPAVDAPNLRDLAGARSGERIILYTGRITSGRGLEEAIRTLPNISDALLVMLGYGADTYLESLFALAAQHGVANRVRLVGPVEPRQVSATAAQADLSIVAIQPTCLSYRHALPNKLFEAVQAGLPVVASDLPDIADLVETHKTGIVCDTDDPTQLADAIRFVLDHRDLFRAGARQAANLLCWESEQEVLANLYRRLTELQDKD